MNRKKSLKKWFEESAACLVKLRISEIVLKMLLKLVLNFYNFRYRIKNHYLNCQHFINISASVNMKRIRFKLKKGRGGG